MIAPHHLFDLRIGEFEHASRLVLSLFALVPLLDGAKIAYTARVHLAGQLTYLVSMCRRWALRIVLAQWRVPLILIVPRRG